MRVVFGREVEDTKLKKPFRLIIGGGSGCGKTSLLKQIVENSHFSTNMLSLLLSTVVPLAFGGSPIPTMKIGIDVNGKDVNLPMSGLGTWQ